MHVHQQHTRTSYTMCNLAHSFFVLFSTHTTLPPYLHFCTCWLQQDMFCDNPLQPHTIADRSMHTLLPISAHTHTHTHTHTFLPSCSTNHLDWLNSAYVSFYCIVCVLYLGTPFWWDTKGRNKLTTPGSLIANGFHTTHSLQINFVHSLTSMSYFPPRFSCTSLFAFFAVSISSSCSILLFSVFYNTPFQMPEWTRYISYTNIWLTLYLPTLPKIHSCSLNFCSLTNTHVLVCLLQPRAFIGVFTLL